MKLNISRKAIYYGLGGGGIIVLAAVGFKLFTPTAPPVQIAPNQFVNVSAIERGVQDCATYIRVGEGLGPSAYLCVRENRDLVVRWQDFPRDTPITITIYRATEGSDTLETWQTVTVTGESGETVVQGNLTAAELGAGGFGNTAFYIEATSPTGTLIFASASSTATSTIPTATTTVPAATSTPTSTVVTPPPPPPPPAPNSTATTAPPAATSTTANSTTTATTTGIIVYYYSPGGTVTGSSTITEPQSNFWVQHVNKKIELGWYSLPPETTRITASRSTSTSGPWLSLLTQERPVTTYYQLYLVDSTQGQTHYYQLESYDGVVKTKTYGPVELPPL